MTIAQIEARRQAAGLTVEALCMAAGVTARTYFYALRAGKARPSTIARLDTGLKKLSGKPADLAHPRVRMVLAVWRSILALAAQRAGMDGAAIYLHAPQKRATLDPEWRAASVIRAQATYLVHTVLGIRQSDLAAALGLTPQAVSASIQGVEDLREDRRVDRDLDWIARQLGEGV